MHYHEENRTTEIRLADQNEPDLERLSLIRVVDQQVRNAGTPVNPKMFGANLPLKTEQKEWDEAIARLIEVGATDLRYPGGSVTEQFFDITDIAGGSHNRSVGSFQDSGDVKLFGFSTFMSVADAVGASATLVVPTSSGFTTSAAEALLAGNYGNRILSAKYLDDVSKFVAVTVQESRQKDVPIGAFEIGNEFWGSGRMTATEYGALAAAVSKTIEDKLFGLGIARPDQPDIVVQTLSSAGVFSPNGESTVFLHKKTGYIYESWQIGRAGIPDIDDLTELTVPSQGRARLQSIDILSAFDQDSITIKEETGALRSFDISDAINAIDGVSEHYYLNGGFDAVNTQEQFMFNQFNYFRQNTDARDSSLPELQFYVTEWNTRRTIDVDQGNNRGLQQAAMNVEMFHEMVANDVSTAHFWPIWFDNSLSGTLICVCRGHLTISGEAFVQLQQTIGMVPSVDYWDRGNIAVHGYENGSDSLFILSERSGATNHLTLDFSEVRDQDADWYRISWTELWDGDAGGQDETAPQTLTETRFVDLVPADDLDAFDLIMQAWSQIYMSVESVTDAAASDADAARRLVSVTGGEDLPTLAPLFRLDGGDGDDTIYGGIGNDEISGRGGNNLLIGGAGADTLKGGFGDDRLFGDKPAAEHYGLDLANKVYRLYQSVLDREPDSTGHANWADRLYSGQLSLEEVAEGFVRSPEFRKNFPDSLSEAGLVTRLYQNVLNREPDAQGFARWTDDLSNGSTVSQIALGFSESPEFINKTSAAANAFAIKSQASAWNDDVFRLYQATLDRQPDVTGHERWTSDLASGWKSFLEVTENFIRAPEFRKTYSDDLNDAGFVTLLYNNVLDRAPDPQGFARWTGDLAAGASRAEVVLGFSQSPQFTANTTDSLKIWMRDQGKQNWLAGGPGDDLVASGQYADVFVFSPNEKGRTTVANLDPWDYIDLTGFGYASATEAKGQMRQKGDDVLFSDQTTEALFRDTPLSQISDDMILL